MLLFVNPLYSPFLKYKLQKIIRKLKVGVHELQEI